MLFTRKANVPRLTLYYKKTCPFCQKVMTFMQQNNISVPLKDRDASPQNRQELIDIGGKPQVPCLVIDGKALYESDDIIRWLGQNRKES